MAEASPICRGKNLTVETVMAFVNAMPLSPMKKAAFHVATETRLKGWTQTHSQIARQLALYYEEDGVCYPRFTQKITYSDVVKYVGRDEEPTLFGIYQFLELKMKSNGQDNSSRHSSVGNKPQ